MRGLVTGGSPCEEQGWWDQDQSLWSCPWCLWMRLIMQWCPESRGDTIPGSIWNWRFQATWPQHQGLNRFRNLDGWVCDSWSRPGWSGLTFALIGPTSLRSFDESPVTARLEPVPPPPELVSVGCGTCVPPPLVSRGAWIEAPLNKCSIPFWTMRH